MPRKPKLEMKKITVVLDGVPVTVTLHPPQETRKSWYAYWPGLVASKSTGQHSLEDAIVVTEKMVRSWKSGQSGKRPTLPDAILSDEEFKAIQCAHFARHHDQAARARAAKTLDDCLEAIDAFRGIINMEPIGFHQPVAAVTPDVCAAFQRKALTLAKNWRKQYHADARVSESVLLRHYAKVTDPERREQSNRTFARIVASLDPDVAARYGHVPAGLAELERRLEVATKSKDWVKAAQLTAELAAHCPR
jgi:hypothetical protein